ncbi:MAG: hypothetical protein E7603_05825 [Ruminococcaceae bacterium]|nr:hypothetical protein [Oscillospiraceae bacterium]
MNIADSIIKNKLKNVYFIWGRGKTTIANRLKEEYGFYIYSTDESRDRQMKLANPIDQPYMCRDFQKEYGVKSFWELSKEVIEEREKHFVAEMTPMMVAELIQLSAWHKYWNEFDGKIGRSLRFDTRNKDGKLGMVSIIIDAKKPIVIGDK